MSNSTTFTRRRWITPCICKQRYRSSVRQTTIIKKKPRLEQWKKSHLTATVSTPFDFCSVFLFYIIFVRYYFRRFALFDSIDDVSHVKLEEKRRRAESERAPFVDAMAHAFCGHHAFTRFRQTDCWHWSPTQQSAEAAISIGIHTLRKITKQTRMTVPGIRRWPRATKAVNQTLGQQRPQSSISDNILDLLQLTPGDCWGVSIFWFVVCMFRVNEWYNFRFENSTSFSLILGLLNVEIFWFEFDEMRCRIYDIKGI